MHVGRALQGAFNTTAVRVMCHVPLCYSWLASGILCQTLLLGVNQMHMLVSFVLLFP